MLSLLKEKTLCHFQVGDRHLQFFSQLVLHHKLCLFQRCLFILSVLLRLF